MTHTENKGSIPVSFIRIGGGREEEEEKKKKMKKIIIIINY